MIRTLAACLILLASSPTWGQAKAVIVGPEKSAPGDLVILETTGSTADAYKWTLANSLKTFKPSDGGKTCIFASGTPGVYIFVLSVSEAGPNGQGPATVDAVTHVLQIGDDPNPPGPGPEPKPPNPPTPDNLTDTGKRVREWALAVGNKAEAKQIAENYSAIVSAIAAGAYKELSFPDARAKIVSDLLALNRKVSDANPKWAVFSQSLAAHTQALDAEGKLDSVDRIKTYFEEIRAGLEAAQ